MIAKADPAHRGADNETPSKRDEMSYSRGLAARVNTALRRQRPGQQPVGGLSRLIYVDDSYDEKHSGFIVFAWVEVRPEAWRVGLRAWLELRKDLFREFTIPPSQELHATQFVSGRGCHVTEASALDQKYLDESGEALKKDVGRAVAVKCLEAIRDCEHLRVGAVFTQTDKRGPEFAQERYALYERLINHWDCEHAEAGTFLMVTMEGEDRHFLEAHRRLSLDERHLIEDPAMHDSSSSQWIQMADLVAYLALKSLNRHKSANFCWDWYNDYLSSSDVNGGITRL